MSIIKTFTEQDFINEFNQSSRHDQFSHDALVVLYNYLDGDGVEVDNVEFDLIAICCEFTEYESLLEVITDYPCIDSIDDIRNNTWCVELSNGAVLIVNF